ncbi:hypothetical protein [Sphingomonas oryzagri]|uniref:Uncharacterized protein n=1 Tax=Sphingomonas oryzagri TaxID=3042314 RepID=A0ABT6N5B8_9SPHN|nr:hypothetical protein [Sphingomonas oryzagri]MDH7640307.1 hypothetical protein [Sphingomonas oryzagri]
MALTQQEEQRLEKAGLITYFNNNRAVFEASAKELLDYLKGNFPAGAIVRHDDVAKSLVGVVEVNKNLQTFLSQKKLKQQYWPKYFTNLILERVWDDIN